MDNRNWIDILTFWSNRSPNKIAFIFPAEEAEAVRALTYRELHETAKVIATNLQSRVAKQSRVLLILPPGPELIEALFGCIYAGLVAVPVPSGMVHSSLKLLASVLAQERPELALIAGQDEAPELTGLAQIGMGAIGAAGAATWEKPEVTLSDLIFCNVRQLGDGQYQGVHYSHQQALESASMLTRRFGLSALDIVVNCLGELNAPQIVDGIFVPVHNGACGCLVPEVAGPQGLFGWLSTFSRYRGTHGIIPAGLPEAGVGLADWQQAKLDLTGINSLVNLGAIGLDSMNEWVTQQWVVCGLHPEVGVNLDWEDPQVTPDTPETQEAVKDPEPQADLDTGEQEQPKAGPESLSAEGEVKQDALLASETAQAEIEIAPTQDESPDRGVVGELVAICRRLLRNDAITGKDNFFESGGDATLANRLIAEIESRFGVGVDLEMIDEWPVLVDLAELIGENTPLAEQPEGIPEAEAAVWVHDEKLRYAPFPLTDVQSAYLAGRSPTCELGNVARQGYMEYEAYGLDAGRFEAAWQRLLQRHDMLRVSIRPDGTQVVAPECPDFAIQKYDLRNLSAKGQETEIARIREERSHLVLPIEQAPLLRVALTRLGEEKWRVHFNFDFLIMDYWSFLLLEQELHELYEAPQCVKPELAMTFRDVVVRRQSAQNQPAFQAAWDYWRERCQTMPSAPGLPLAIALTEIEQPLTERYITDLKSETWQQLQEKAQSYGITPTIALLTAFADVLKLWSDSERFTLNLTLFDRAEEQPDLTQMIGDFTTVNVIELDYRNLAVSFVERARANQRRLAEDQRHKEVDGVRVVRELARLSGNAFRAIMPIVFTSTLNSSGQLREPAFDWLGKNTYTACQTPQVYFDHQAVEDTAGLHCSWDVVEELFPAGVIGQMRAAFEALLLDLARGDEAWQQIEFPEINLEEPDVTREAKLVVLDSAGRICPNWVIGQLHIQGVEVENDTGSGTEKMVATGLKARRIPGGRIQVVGNASSQTAYWEAAAGRYDQT